MDTLPVPAPTMGMGSPSHRWERPVKGTRAEVGRLPRRSAARHLRRSAIVSGQRRLPKRCQQGRLVLRDQPARCRLTCHLTPSVAYPKILPVWTTSESDSRAARGAQAPESETPLIAATNQPTRCSGRFTVLRRTKAACMRPLRRCASLSASGVRDGRQDRVQLGSCAIRMLRKSEQKQDNRNT
jgi:hypothetical protein